MMNSIYPICRMQGLMCVNLCRFNLPPADVFEIILFKNLEGIDRANIKEY